MAFKKRYMMTEEHKRKIGLANAIANKGKESPMKGKHHTEETKQRLSEFYKGKSKINIDKDRLFELYITNKKTALECAKYFRCSEGCIVDRLKIYGIKQRTKSESKLKELNPAYGKKSHNSGKTADTYLPLRIGCKKQRETLKRKFANGEIVHYLQGKNLEEFYGVTKAKEIRAKLSNSHKNYLTNHPEEIQRLLELRRNLVIPVKDTSIELKIQNFLKQMNIEFFTHQYMKDIEHGYQCDILINPQQNFMAQNKTIIEVDGDYWHCNPTKYPTPINQMQKDQIEEDACRNEELRVAGFNVIRLWEIDIKQMDLEDFKNIVFKKVNLLRLN